MTVYELDHWTLFDSLSNDQVGRLKNVIDSKVSPEAVEESGESFSSMLSEESEKLG